MDVSLVVDWTRNWLVGDLMMLATVTFYVAGLCALEWGLRWRNQDSMEDHSFRHFLFLTLITAVVALTLHILEGFAWAGLYLALDVLPNDGSEVLYSLNALTSYGHEQMDLADSWRLLGPIQSMGGMVTFGLTTAFIFGISILIRPQRQHWIG